MLLEQRELNVTLGKKLQRRLKDLERRAGSSSASSKTPPESSAASRSGMDGRHVKNTPDVRQLPRAPGVPPSQYMLPMTSDDSSIFGDSFEPGTFESHYLYAPHIHPTQNDFTYQPYAQSNAPIFSSDRCTKGNVWYSAPGPTLSPSIMLDDTVQTSFNATHQGLPAADIDKLYD